MRKKEILDDSEFYEFVLREFEDTVQYALVEDLAIFAFGSVDEAISCFHEKNKNG